jgi:hypothetical protein
MNDAVTKRPPALGPLARQLSRNVADTIGSAVPNPPRTMLLCVSRGPDDISLAAVLGLRGGVPTGLLLVCGQDRDGPLQMERKLL